MLSIVAYALKLRRYSTLNEACQWHSSGSRHVSSTPLLKLLLAHLGLASNKGVLEMPGGISSELFGAGDDG